MKNPTCQKQKKRSLFPFLLLLFIILAVASIFMGRYSITPQTLLELLGNSAADSMDKNILFEVRLTRIGAAVMIGIALAAAGSAYQGIFKNPMVSPDILGASAGGGFGASLAISLGGNPLVVQVFAFACGLLAVALAYTLSMAIGRKSGATFILVLTGMVVGALFQAGIAIVKYLGDPYDTLPAITFWLMGGLNYVVVQDLLVMLVPFILGVVPLVVIRWRLNVLSLGDEEAGALGMNTSRMRLLVIICATLLSSSAVAIGGMIGWVGLIIPHLARMLAGPDYYRLLPAAMVIGGIFLLGVDDIARSAFPSEIPLGVLTAVAGAPFFIWLLFKGKRSFL